MMNTLINYFIEANLILLISGLFYVIFLRNAKQFRLARINLIVIFLASLCIPLLHFQNPMADKIPVHQVTDFTALIPDLLIQNIINDPITKNQTSSLFSLPVILILIYAGVMLVLFTLFASQLFQIIRLRNRSEGIEKKDGYVIIPTNGQWPTFTFFNMLFFDNSKILSEEEKQKILDHELVHINEKHSVDIILIELMKILFWLNPIIWMLRASLEEVHEYLADQKILKNTDKNYYSSLLAKMALNQISLSVGLHFNRSIILKRIEMMKTPKTKFQVWKWSSMFTIVALIAVVFSCNDEVMNDVMETSTQMEVPPELRQKLVELQEEFPDAEFIYVETDGTNKSHLEQLKDVNPHSIGDIYIWPDKSRIGALVNKHGPLKSVAKKDEDGIYNIVDTPAMPVGGYEAYYAELNENLKYPAEARKAGVEGTVYILFVIDEQGNIGDAQVVRGIGYGADEAALEAFKTTGNWSAPMQEGKPVKQRIVLPVKFSMAPKHEIEFKVDKMVLTDDVVQQVDETAKPNEGFEQFYKSVGEKIKGKTAGEKGTVYIQLLINTDGKIFDSKVIKSENEKLNQIALDAVLSAGDWDPARINNDPIEYKVVLPIKIE